jgi:hypothetical protein
MVRNLYGQTYIPFRTELELIKNRANWTFGPFLIDPSLRFDFSYDNNVYGTYGRQEPIPDYVASIAVPISVYLPLRNRLILSFTDTPEYLYFVDLENERTFNNSYSLGARILLLNRLALSGTYGFNRAKYRFSSEIERRAFQQIEASGASLFLETARGTAIGFVGLTNRYTYEEESFPGQENSLSTSLNRKEDNLRLEFYRQVWVDSSFFVNVGYTDYAFDNPQASFRDSYSYQGNVGIRFPLLGRARGLLSLGYKNFTPRQPGKKRYSGPVGNTGLDFRIARFGLRFQLFRDVPFSYAEASVFYIDSRAGAGLSFYLTRNIRLDYDFSIGRNEYPEGVLISLPDGTSREIRRKDNFLSHSGGIIFRILRNTGIGFRISYWKRDSNYFVYNSDRWTAGAFIIYDF